MTTNRSSGVLELHPKGFGFLRNLERSFAPQPGDAFVPAPLIQRFRLREGLLVTGETEPPRRGDGPRLTSVEELEGLPRDQFQNREFDQLTPIDPEIPIRLETGREPLTTRVMDMLTPIGKGQRGLIVAPPRSGKTVLLQQISQAVVSNHPEMQLFFLLVDERPEEVTETTRSLRGFEQAKVFASSSDQDAEKHVRISEIVLERAKRLAESGREVFVLLDSLTRLARAYNKLVRGNSRTMTGGMDQRALEMPKRLFGYSRALEEGGSLTILGTALVETGSRMDDLIFEELKGTGNMELVLDRKLADRRIFPAINVRQSGTRKEERLIPEDDLRRINLIRRALIDRNPTEAVETLLNKMSKTESNEEFLDMLRDD